ncbi:MAG: AMP-binding protein [Planctomycetota bacterium]
MTLEKLLRASWDRHADRTAVDADRRLTYAELGRETLQLADRLRALGVKRGERVLLARPKGADGIVGMLGILLAGGAYVPVEPDGPAERRRKIEDDCRPIAVVGDSIDGKGGRADASTRNGDDLAAILYTSGSTGAPKGVSLADGNILHFVEWMVREFGVGPEDRLANHAPYLFDLSLFDHFGAFRAGAAVVPVPKEQSLFPASLAKFIGEKRITVWYSVPFVLVGLAERGALSKADLSALRLVLFAGEVFPMGPLRKLAASLPGVALANLFGPTETNVCTFHRVRPEDLDRDELPIGVPAPGFETKVENGELLVRGPGVMRGYWGSEPVTGWYRTGDRVEERDGVFRLLGRVDRMVKVRGYRVEPAEIEAALHKDSGVREAAVVAVPDFYGQKALAASIVPAEGTDVPDVAASLRERLPAYMIPAKIRFLRELPRTTTGKVDYQALAGEEDP